MTIEVRLAVAEADLATYDTIRLERAPASDGFLAGGASEIASIALVEDVTAYEYSDVTGHPLSWYRTRLATGDDPPVFGAYSAAFRGDLVPLVPLATFLAEIGLAADDPRVARARLLLRAISARIRRITRRGLEGSPTTYDEIYRLDGARELTLRNGPVESIASIRRVAFDGTESDPYLATDWRLEDARRGIVRLFYRPPYVRVVYATTGEIGPEIEMDALEWGATRWNSFGRDAALASYSTGSDSESYETSLAGAPPADVARSLAGLTRLTGGGPI